MSIRQDATVTGGGCLLTPTERRRPNTLMQATPGFSVLPLNSSFEKHRWLLAPEVKVLKPAIGPGRTRLRIHFVQQLVLTMFQMALVETR